MNPYETLGLAPDASEDDVKRAHRAKAKAAHPDTGGDTDKMVEINRAAMILRDPERRKRYDETGNAEEAESRDIDGPALGIIAEMLQTILMEGTEDNVATVDLVDAMRQQLDDTINNLKSGLAKGQRAVRRANKIKARFTRKSKDNHNMMAMILDKQIAGIEREMANVTRAKQKHKRAREIVLDHAFEVEKAEVKTNVFTGAAFNDYVMDYATQSAFDQLARRRR